jgi:hypothetical protein
MDFVANLPAQQSGNTMIANNQSTETKKKSEKS